MREHCPPLDAAMRRNRNSMLRVVAFALFSAVVVAGGEGRVGRTKNPEWVLGMRESREKAEQGSTVHRAIYEWCRS